MTLTKIREARVAALEFIKRANLLEECINNSRSDYGWTVDIDDFPKERGALRRQSMELTRALAEMRRPC